MGTQGGTMRRVTGNGARRMAAGGRLAWTMVLLGGLSVGSAMAEEAATCRIQGFVFDEQGSPVAGVVVRFSGGPAGQGLPTEVTDETGYFEAPCSGEVGQYAVRPAKAGYDFEPAAAKVWISGGDATASFAARRSKVVEPVTRLGDAYEADDTVAAAKGISPKQAQNRSIHVVGNVDWATFTLKKLSDVRIETTGLSGDTDLSLYGPDDPDTLVACDDDGGSGLFACISRTGPDALGPGTYHVRVSAYANSGTIDAYVLRLTVEKTNDKVKQIKVKGAPASGEASSIIAAPCEADFYYFDVPAGQGGIWNLWVQLGGLPDSVLRLDNDLTFSPALAFSDDCCVANCTLNHSRLHSRIDYALVAGKRYYLKVSGYGASTGTYTIHVRRASAGSLAVTSPNSAGITWVRGSAQTIAWTSAGGAGATVKVDLCKGGVLSRTIAASTPNTGSFVWTVPADQALGTDYRVRVTSTAAASAFDESDANFAIAEDQGTLIPVSGNPASGSAAGTISVAGEADLFCFDVPADQGGTWNLWVQLGSLADSALQLDGDPAFNPALAANDDCGTAGCTLNHASLHSRIDATLTAGQRYYLKVKGASVATGSYTIRVQKVPPGTLAMSNPNAPGMTWTCGTPCTIQWTSTGEVGSAVKLDLYRAGVLSQAIVASTPNTGSYSWTVPASLAAGADYKVRVTATTNAAISDESDNPFAVAAQPQTAWTFLVYLDGDNSLDLAGVEDFNEMERAANNPNVNIVVCWDRSGSGNSAYYKVKYDTSTTTAAYTEGVDKWAKGELNMGDPTTLSAFLTWAIARFPAQHYAVVLWDHGAGWGPRATLVAAEKPKKGCCWDDSNGSDYLTCREVQQALATAKGALGRSLDLVGFDCCLMGMVEVAYELKDVADHFVASEETEPGDGWEYDGVLPQIGASTGGAGLAAAIVNAYAGRGETMGAFRASGLSALATQINSLAGTLRARMAAERGNLDLARGSALSFDIPSYVDIEHLMGLIETRSSDAAVDAACASVRTALGAARIASTNSGGIYGNARGLSIYFPTSTSDVYGGDNFYDNYQNVGSYAANLAFVAATQWDEFLAEYLNRPAQQIPVAGNPASGSVAGTIAAAGGAVTYYFDVPAGQGGTWNLWTQTGSLSDTVLYLDNGTDFSPYLAYNDDCTVAGCTLNHTSLHSRIDYTLTAGQRYYLRVKGYGSGTGTYTLHVRKAQ